MFCITVMFFFYFFIFGLTWFSKSWKISCTKWLSRDNNKSRFPFSFPFPYVQLPPLFSKKKKKKNTHHKLLSSLFIKKKNKVSCYWIRDLKSSISDYTKNQLMSLASKLDNKEQWLWSRRHKFKNWNTILSIQKKKKE